MGPDEDVPLPESDELKLPDGDDCELMLLAEPGARDDSVVPVDEEADGEVKEPVAAPVLGAEAGQSIVRTSDCSGP
jgi:hypothetical protein